MIDKKMSLPPSLADQFIILIGLMGAGKSSLGHRLAAATGLPFKDSDVEVERAAGCTIQEIFDRYGEAEFREGEKKVIARLFGDEPSVVATGGGSFMNDEIRRLIKKTGISVWLRADLDLLDQRTQNRSHRPLLNQEIGENSSLNSCRSGILYMHTQILFLTSMTNPRRSLPNDSSAL